MLAVHVHILDAVTKQPTPVRLRVSDASGKQYMPLGQSLDFPCGKGEDVGGHLRLSGGKFAYIDGRCEIKLPSETPLTIEALKGFEYMPLIKEVILGSGQISLRLPIVRWSNVAERGWHSGDSRAHFLTPHAAMLEAAAEDLTFTNLLAHTHPMLAHDGHSYTLTPNLLAFSGQVPALRGVYVNTLNTHPVLGKLALLHTHRPIYPLSFGWHDESDDWSLFDWCGQCHRKKGLAVWVDAPDGGEALAAAILGLVDAIEFTPKQSVLPWYYQLLNSGVFVPLVAGSGKDSNNIPLGAMRTFAKCDGSYAGWIEAVRQGESFATNGPLLEMSVEGSHVSATAASVVPFQTLDIVADGSVLATVPAAELEGRWTAKIELSLTTEPSWLAARCVGAKGFAHTSPLKRAGSPPRKKRDLEVLLQSLESAREWANERGCYADRKWQSQLLGNLERASAILMSRERE